MELELYAVMMRNDLNEKCAVLFLDNDPTDAEYKAKRYAKQLNAIVERAYRSPDINDILVMKTNRRTKEGS